MSVFLVAMICNKEIVSSPWVYNLVLGGLISVSSIHRWRKDHSLITE